MNAEKLLSSLALGVVTATLAWTPARAQDSPPAPDASNGPGARTETPAPAPSGAPAERAPVASPSPTPAAQPTDEGASGLWLGSKPGTRIEAGLELFYATFKSRSHFGFAEHNGRGEETAFVEDCGWPSNVLMEGAAVRLDLGILGWVGADVLGFAVSDERGNPTRERQTNGVLFEPGDTLHSHGQILWGHLSYGYELGYRLELGGVPIALAGSPSLALGAIDEDVRVRRVAPEPTSELGGHILALNVVPGLRGYADFFDHVKLGFDVAIPGAAIPLTNPKVHTNERYSFYLGLHAFHVELDFGWELVANHLLGTDRATDMRFIGYTFQLKAEF